VVRIALASALAFVSVLAHAEPQNASYFCAADAAAGLKYDAAAGKWSGTSLRPDTKFILKLTFNRTYTRKFTYSEEEVDEYLANVVKLQVCVIGTLLTVTDTDAVNSIAMVNGAFRCSTMTQQYEFNIRKSRYFNTYNFGYINGANDDMPTITGGTCVKTCAFIRTVTGTVTPRAER